MFNLGLPEIIILGVVALLLFGPKRLPELAKGLGKGLRDFKKAIAGEYDEPSVPRDVSTHNEPEAVKPKLKMVSGGAPAKKSGKKKKRSKAA